MAFDVSALSAWNNEISDKSQIILEPILGARTLKMVALDKRNGITDATLKIPTFESTTPWQAGASCGFTTSGTTTINQISLTGVSIKVQESICLQDLEKYFSQQWLPKGDSRPETFQILDIWTSRKMAQIARFVESVLWQGNTATTNDSHLKQMNGYIQKIDAATDEVLATAQASISTSTVRGIFEDTIFTRIPSAIFNEAPEVYCGEDTFKTLQLKLMQDNLYHYEVPGSQLDSWTMTYPGSNIKVKALPGLNNDNVVETGALPTAAKNRVFATYPSNLLVGFNAENNLEDFKVWYSDDNQLLRFNARFHLGVAIKYTKYVVSYLNS